MHKILLFTIFTCLISHKAFSQETVSIDSVAQFNGHYVKVCAKVMGTYLTKGEKPVTYLNLGAPYPNTKLTVVIFQVDLANFSKIPTEYYKDQNVCVTGKIKEYREKMEMIIKKEDEIEVMQ